MLSAKLFKDNYARAQPKDKFTSKFHGPFTITELVGKNALKLELPEHIKIHPVVNVSFTKPYKVQPKPLIANEPPRGVEPVANLVAGTQPLFKVAKILAHRMEGRGFQWLTLLENSPTHDAEWQPTRDFIDKDGTVTKAFYDYIVEHNLLHHLH